MDKIILKSNIINDEYTDYIYHAYDIQNRNEIITEIPSFSLDDINFSWNIGVICGNSGSGKTSLLKTIGEIKTPTYNSNKCVISQFPNLSVQDACNLLHSVGLSSIPTWLNKPNNLSNGEKARLDIAWTIANNNNDIIIVDEFTSTVNRLCAQSLSYSLQRYIRSSNKKIILSTCHFDLIDWLQPDWIVNLNKLNNNNIEIERLIYSDDENYEAYNNINKKDILTDEKYIN